MADIQATTISDRLQSVQGNRRVVTGTVVTGTTAAGGEDTVFAGLTDVTAVSAYFATTALTSVHGLTCFPSTVTVSGFVLRTMTTHANFPIAFRVEGV